MSSNPPTPQASRRAEVMEKLSDIQGIAEREVFPYMEDIDRLNEIAIELPNVSEYIGQLQAQLTEKEEAEKLLQLKVIKLMEELAKKNEALRFIASENYEDSGSWERVAKAKERKAKEALSFTSST